MSRTRIIQELDREAVERLAAIVGSSSAAAAVLKAAERFTEPVFFRDVSGDSIVVCDRSTFDNDFKPLVPVSVLGADTPRDAK